MTDDMKTKAGMGTAFLAATLGVLAGGAMQAQAVQAGADEGAACPAGPQARTTDEACQAADARVSLDMVEGSFSFTQAEAASNDYLARNFAEGSKYLCGAQAAQQDVDAQDWVFTVEGAVDKAYSATARELADSPAVQALLMGCSCAGNPADGTAAANALVQGISALVMVQMAEPVVDANTVVFTSSDGYEVALPLSYLESHYCPIVFDVNGSPIADSMGGANQLWLGSTPASYFVRNVSSVRVEARAEADVPQSPTSDEARAEFSTNLPNVGVLLGGEVA